jgi:predicted transcriptional regulator
MAAESLSMRTIREVLRLKAEKKLSNKKIAESCNIVRSTVRDYLWFIRFLCTSGCILNSHSFCNISISNCGMLDASRRQEIVWVLIHGVALR